MKAIQLPIQLIIGVGGFTFKRMLVAALYHEHTVFWLVSLGHHLLVLSEYRTLLFFSLGLLVGRYDVIPLFKFYIAYYGVYIFLIQGIVFPIMRYIIIVFCVINNLWRAYKEFFLSGMLSA